jgi:hypothetical protein
MRLLPEQIRQKGFHTLILADLLFNHSEHQKLLQTVQRTLKRDTNAYALVFFTPYRPWLLEKDLAFFDIAKNAGFHVEKIFEKLMDKVMFEEDPGVSHNLLPVNSFVTDGHDYRTRPYDEQCLATSCSGLGRDEPCHSWFEHSIDTNLGLWSGHTSISILISQ